MNASIVLYSFFTIPFLLTLKNFPFLFSLPDLHISYDHAGPDYNYHCNRYHKSFGAIWILLTLPQTKKKSFQIGFPTSLFFLFYIVSFPKWNPFPFQKCPSLGTAWPGHDPAEACRQGINIKQRAFITKCSKRNLALANTAAVPAIAASSSRDDLPSGALEQMGTIR